MVFRPAPAKNVFLELAEALDELAAQKKLVDQAREKYNLACSRVSKARDEVADHVDKLVNGQRQTIG